MKKFIAILLILIFTLSLASCSSAYEDVTKQLKELHRSAYFYTESQIENLMSEYKITEVITAFGNYSYVDDHGTEIYLYVVELKTEKEAKSYLEKHAKFWKYGYTSGNVVVYGNDSLINDLDL